MSRRRIWLVTAIGLVVVIGLDLVVRYARFPGYGAVLGFAGCFLLVHLAKAFGRTVVQRPERYYPDDVIPDVQDDVGPDAAAASGPDAGPQTGGEPRA